MRRLSDSAPWPGEDTTLPAWAFPSQTAFERWRDGDVRRHGVMARHAWAAGVRWALTHTEAREWIDGGT